MKKLFSMVVVALLASATLSCHHHHDEEEHHHHGEPMTAYQDGLELFAEVAPLVVGEDCDILAHFTRLSDFKPLDSASITMILKVEGKEQRVSLESPHTPGIYPFEITPQTAGCGSMMFEVKRGDSVVSIGFSHVHVVATHDALHGEDDHDHEHEGHDHHHAETSANTVTFTKEQSWKIDFATAECRKEQFGAVIRTTAQVMPSQGDERVASAKASGIVVFSNPNLVEGAAVSAGQQLFSIESGALADNNMGVRFQEVSANYAAAKSDYERKQQLAADRIVSQSDLERSRAAYETAKAAYDNLKGNFSQRGAVVTAPIGGFVKSIAVKNGSFVESGQSVVTVSQNRDLFLRAEVQPSYYRQLKNIVSANFVIPNDSTVYSIDQLDGALVGYGRATDASNPLIPVTFRFRNTLDLMPGAFVSLFIRTVDESKVIAVPNQGIIEEMGSYFVFVQLTPELFEKRAVSIGATDGRRTVVTSGLAEGERVVTKGAGIVRLAQGAGALDPHAGHVH